MKTLFYFVTLLLILPSNGSTESSFFKKYPGQLSNCGYALAISTNEMIGVAGLQFDSTGGRSIMYGQMDSDGKGTTLYEYNTGRPDDTISAIAPAPDGGFVLAASTSGDKSFRDILIFKIRSNGSIVWKKRIATTSQEFVYQIKSVSGGYILVGGATTGSNVDALLLKINEAGTVLWKRTYGNSDSELGYSVAPSENSGLILAGLKEDSPFVLKLDSSGRRVWGRLVQSEHYSDDGRISVFESGGFFYLAGTSTRGAHSHGGVEHTGISITKLSSSGKWIWTKEYHSEDPVVLWNASHDKDGNIVIGGHSGAFTAKALVFKINPEGKILWKRAYSNENSAAFFIATMSDGGVLATGCTGKERLELYLAKTDSKGNIPMVCALWKSIPLEIDAVQDQVIAFNPEEKPFPGISSSASITTRKINTQSRDLCNR